MPRNRGKRTARVDAGTAGMAMGSPVPVEVQRAQPNGGAPPSQLDELNTAEMMKMLREFPAFQLIMNLMQQMVIASLKMLEDNDEPAKDSYFKLQWRSFKTMYEAINGYMDNVIMSRLALVKEMLLDLGFDEEFATRHSELSFQGFMPQRPLSSYPRAGVPAPSPFAGVNEQEQ